MLKYRLHTAWTDPAEYAKAVKWIDDTDGISLDLGLGHSWINGVVYYAYINMQDESLLLLFKLLFPTLTITFFMSTPNNATS